MKKLITVLTIFTVAFAFTGLVLAKGASDLEPRELENKITVQPPSDITLDYCGLAMTNGVGSSVTSYMPGWQTVTYFDPATCPGVPTYPFEITALSFTLYDMYGSSPWPYPIDVVVYDMLQPGDPCQGPGAELCRFTVTCDQASFEYPNVGTATFPQVCCVNGPFFIGLDLTDPYPLPPGPVYDDQIPPCCDNWFFFPPSWGDWCWAWGDPPSVGYPLFWVDGETPPNNCEEFGCENHKMHYPQLPDPNGWDVNATGNVSLPNSIMLADDFRCSETGYIDDMHFWGSWKDDIEGQVIMFHLAIYDNVPEGPHGYSEPGQELWWTEIYEPEFTVTPEDPSGEQGWYDPINGEILPLNHQAYYRYDVIFPPGLGFWQVQGEIYWLKISAFINDPENTAWGWKTSFSPLFMDDAVYDSYAAPTGWRELYEPMPEPPIVNDFWAFFGPGGELIDGGGADAYGEGWYYYPSTNWWNIWFYDHPLVPGRKYIHVEFDAFGPGTETAIFAVNWSTDQWDVPGEPPLPGVDENLYIGRAEFPIIEGHNIFDWDIPTYNPEWVSIDFRVFEPMDIPGGIIDHQCIPSLDLAFCITGEGGTETGACCWTDGSCTMENQSICEDNGGVFYPGQNCADVECPVEDPVYDLWETPDGHNTFVDFGCGPSTPPLPADFFGPGSDPFDGIIALVGEPLATTGNLGPTDAIIKRYRAADLADCPSQDEIELEIVALNLVSVEPITVTYDGGQNPEDWDITVCLSEFRDQLTGIMNINQVCQEGGTFNAYVPVVPKIIFTRISDGMEMYVDYGEWGLPAIELNVEDGHWMFSDPGFNVYTSNVGDLVSNCDDEPDILIGRSAVDLIPGLQAIPCIDCSQPAVDYDIPITSLLEPAGCAQHDVWPPHDVVEDIPTLTEWGMIILALLLLSAGTVAVIWRRKAAMARTN